MNDNNIDRLEARSKELISKANDYIEARERLVGINDKLDTIPRLDDIIAAWDNYTHLMAGEWQRFGNSLLDGRFVETPELHKEGILLLSECRDLLLPYQELLSDINLDFCLIRDKLNDFFIGHRDIDNYLDILEAFFNEFDSAQYEIEALTPKDSRRHEDEKKPRPRKQSKTIKDCILLQDEEQKNELLKVLHSLLDNKLGRFAGLVVAISVKLGLLARPKFKILAAEFVGIGCESGFNKYYIIAEKALKGEINTYQKEEISIIKDKFSCFVTQDNSAK